MPDLAKSLQGRDLGHLRIVAELWGVEVDAPDVRLALLRLTPRLLDRSLVEEVVGSLPTEAKAVLEALIQNGGRLPWPAFIRRFGVLREMGVGKRDRDQPYMHPVSPVEMLWYRALVARSFFDTPAGPEEFAFIPDDLIELIPATHGAARPPLGRLATPLERAHPIPAHDRLLDHACTLLAALRLKMPDNAIAVHAAGWKQYPEPLSAPALRALLSATGLLGDGDLPQIETTRLFLEAGRGEALASLARAWLNSLDFNELRLLPSLQAEGDWQNDPRRARQMVLDFLATVPGGGEGEERPFWSLEAFVQDIHQHYPDFQRTAGDYDSWFLRRVDTGEFLRGVERWDEVDGALIRFFITGPLHWLGILDLASPAAPDDSGAVRVTAFRHSEWAAALLHGQPPANVAIEDVLVQVRSDARLVVPWLAPRAVRYQLARFNEWEQEKADAYHYRLTPTSLLRARQQGLTTNHLLALLRRHAKTIAPSLVKAIERWERLGVEASLQHALVLRLSTPELLQTLRSSRAARFLGEPLGPTTVIVKPGAADKVLAILAEMGILGQMMAGKDE